MRSFSLSTSVYLHGVTCEDIADAILAQLVEWQLQPELLCGQAYDGAGAMAGKSWLSVYAQSIPKPCTPTVHLTADWNRETQSDAHSLLLSMSQFSFIVALVLTQKVLSYMKGSSCKVAMLKWSMPTGT